MRTLLAFALVLALLAPASAHHCTTYSTSTPDYDSNPHGLPGVPRYYVFNDDTQFGLFSIWVYEETNGIDGPQREDEVHDDTCHGVIDGDRIIF